MSEHSMVRLSERDWEAVRKVSLFAGLPIGSVEALIDHATIEEAPVRTMLFHQGDEVDRFYIIIEGWVKLSRLTAEGDQAVIAVFTRGEPFAQAAMFDSGRYPVSAETVAPSRLLSVPAGSFMAKIENDGALAMRMLAAMSRQLRYLVQQVEQLQAKSAPQRVGNFLLPLLPRPDRPGTIHLPYDKSLIAARLGMKPETFSRAMAKLREVGVRTEGNAVIVPEPDRLKRYCE